MKYCVWKDVKYEYSYGTIEQAGNNEIVNYYSTLEEARIAWKWYYYNP